MSELNVARRTSVLIAAAGVAAAVAIVILGWNRAPEDVATVGSEIATQVIAVAQQSAARAQAIARVRRLGWAVATDEATMLDLTAGELAMSALDGETVAVAQIGKRSRRVTWLWRAGRPLELRLPEHPSGVHALVDGEELVLLAVTPVAPEARRNEIAGAVVVARTVPRAPLDARLAALGLSARLETANGGITIGRIHTDGQTHAVHPPAGFPEELQISITAPPGGASPLSLAIASLVLGVSLALGSLSSMRRRARAFRGAAPSRGWTAWRWDRGRRRR